MKISFIYLLLIIIGSSSLHAQFSDAAGKPGSTAISVDDAVIVDWASGCAVQRGLMHSADSTLGYASYGKESNACGKADMSVVSLGDGGQAVLTFSSPIYNDIGPDFAVFENSFDDHFLELAFVEVSSDGKHYFRFPAISKTQSTLQIGAFDYIKDITGLNNLAGKYRGLYGTPFDLQELDGIEGLNINAITHVKIVDVVGSVQSEYASKDSQGNIINEPWPTPFESSGFDVDAVAVMHSLRKPIASLTFQQNPITNDVLNVCAGYQPTHMTLYSMQGIELKTVHEGTMNIAEFPAGMYIVKTEKEGEILSGRILVVR